jgi:hypothetical protein
MILARLVFQAKFGKAGELAAMFKEFGESAAASGMVGPRSMRILTDLSGSFDTVVQEIEFDSFAAWEESQAAMFANPALRPVLQRTGELIAGGYKEFYTVEGQF